MVRHGLGRNGTSAACQLAWVPRALSSLLACNLSVNQAQMLRVPRLMQVGRIQRGRARRNTSRSPRRKVTEQIGQQRPFGLPAGLVWRGTWPRYRVDSTSRCLAPMAPDGLVGAYRRVACGASQFDKTRCPCAVSHGALDGRRHKLKATGPVNLIVVCLLHFPGAPSEGFHACAAGRPQPRSIHRETWNVDKTLL